MPPPPARLFSIRAVFGLFVWAMAGSAAAQGPPPGDMPPPEVTVEAVRAADLDYPVDYAARVAGSRDVQVRARVGGILLERAYQEGAEVKAGDLLFRIDPEPYQVRLARSQAQLHQEEARLLSADRNWKRIEPLFRSKTASGRERDDALSALELAQASVALAEAEVRAAGIDLGYTEVKAPIGGVTSREAVSEGSLIGVGREDGLLTSITQLDPAYVNFAIPESEMALLRDAIQSGQLRIDVITAGGARLAKDGKLTYTDQMIDSRTGTAQARAVLQNPEQRLLPGQFVRAVLRGVVLKGAISIPARALLQGADGPYVLTVKDVGAGVPEIRPVTLGPEVKGRLILTGGVREGEFVVVEGMIKVMPGQPVRASLAGPTQ